MAKASKTSRKLSAAAPAASIGRHWQLLVASAGTGKTEKIQGLVLERILDTRNTVTDALEKTLLVSFTDTAAAELRSRVHGTIAHAVDALRGRVPWRNGLLEAVVAAAPEADDAKHERLVAAQATIDRLTIGTIHSVCKQILNTYPIESGVRTGLVIAADLSEVEEEAIADASARLVHEYDSRGLWTAGFETKGGFSGSPQKNPDPKAPTADRLRRLARCVIETDLPLEPGSQPALTRGGAIAQGHAAHGIIAEWFAHEVRNRLRLRKARLGVMSLGDLVHLVDDALRGPALSSKLAGKWDHIILDEAQDTDAAQWRILEALSPTTFIAVGDPKQSIFSFRGAHYNSLPPLQTGGAWKTPDYGSLTKNFRTDAPLLHALNRFFGNGSFPGWQPVSHAYGCRLHEKSFAASNAESGLYFHLAPRPPAGKHAVEHVFAQVAEGILAELNAGLIVSEKDHPGARQENFGPKHVAVLVRSNRAGEEMRKVLIARGIPVAAASTASLLDSDELRDVAAVFAAIAEPYKRSRVAAAAMTRIVGCDNAQLNKMLREGDSSDEWQALIDRLARLREALALESLASVLEQILDSPWFPKAESARERILQEPDGEQVVKNLLDIGALLTRELWRRYGCAEPPSTIAQWLLKASARAAARELVDEEEQNAYSVALATDEDAVRIMTVHAAKGRQFGSVWLPEAWWSFSESRYRDNGQAWRMAKGNEIILRIAPGDARAVTAARNSAVQDALAEEQRLLYVAATRARHRTHIIAGCFDPPDRTPHLPIGHFLDPTNPLIKEDEESRLASILGGLKAAAAKDGGVVIIETLPGITAERFEADKGKPAPDLPPVCVPGPMRLTSFSSLSGFAKTGRQIADDAVVALQEQASDDAAFPKSSDDEDDVDVEAAGAGAAKSLPIPLAALPGGTKYGDFVHNVLEYVLPWTRPIDEPGLAAVIREFAASSSFPADSAIETTLAEPLWRALNQPLGGPFGETSLLGLTARGDVTTELPFTLGLGLNPKTPPADLHAIFADHDDGDFEGFADLLKPLKNTDVRGLLNGYLDLVWRSHADGRVVILDYKTNLLRMNGEPSLDAYRRAELQKKLGSSFYLLQAALYAAVVHAWMSQTEPAWDYDTHFKGVSFVFLRAMGPHAANDPDNGVYHVTVPRSLADGLVEKAGIGPRRVAATVSTAS